MTERPYDIVDLFLAPGALAIDARILELGALDDEKLAYQVALASDEPYWSVELRKDALLRTLTHLIELHGWLVSWDDRGIRVLHGDHSVVLGTPASFGRYLEGAKIA